MYKGMSTNDKYDFYHSQRRAFAILEVVREIKSNYYEAKVVSIESDENFQVMGQAGGCKHQYKIGDTFTLRHHKNKKGNRLQENKPNLTLGLHNGTHFQ